MPTKHDDDPICGKCNRPESQHYKQRMGLFCKQHGVSVFTVEPSDSVLLTWFRRVSPGVAEQIEADWKREHGHGG